MGLKDILVHIDGTPHCESRFRVAALIAEQHDALLIALFTETEPDVPGFSGETNKRKKYFKKVAEKAEAFYTRLAKELGVRIEWHTAKYHHDERRVTDALIHYTRHCDMAVVSQYDPETAKGRIPRDMPESLVLETGRPILVVPYAGEFPHLGKRVVIAWNTGRESVRAANDAIPLMQEAKKVKVIAINPKQETKKHAGIPAKEMVRHLQRHGISAQADDFSTKGVDEGNLILNTLADERADLLVMGAYGHHRFRELILGGVTQLIFEHMTTPVLMSH